MALEPLEILYEARLPAYPMPDDLERIYGRLGFDGRVVYSNFVSSLDGVVTLGDVPSAGSVISGKYPADRFVMALLRACADAVIIGAGTLRATPGHIWTAAHVYPELAASFVKMRTSLGRAAEPQLAVVTASGQIDPTHPALVKGALVLTTAEGAKKMGGRIPATCEVLAIGGSTHVEAGAAIAELRRRGFEVVLTEGGPHLVGTLIAEGVLDEMFLTLSPALAGREAERRLGMVEGIELLPTRGVWTRLSSVRRHGDYLFLRHRLPAREARA